MIQGLNAYQDLTLKEILIDFDIQVKPIKKIEITPNYIIYHYDLYDISKIAKVEKVSKYLSALLHSEVNYYKSDIAHFGIAVAKSNRDIINYNTNKIKDKLQLEKPYSVLVGVDDKNQYQFVNLNDIPHILVAGASGSGKSVLLHNMICSLLVDDRNNNLEFVFIDTKRVELTQYSELKNLMCPVAITEDYAVEVLSAICKIIDLRYQKMQQMNLRKANDEFSHIVIVIDEFADLMGLCGKMIERFIVRISQLGRACNIHLIIATQRPTANVITGLIKSNIPCKIGLQTSSVKESVNVLDHKGCEKLKGKGDCLLKIPSQVEEIHLQCPYISDEQINNIIKEIKGE